MNTITSSREIDELFASGKRLFTPYLTIIYSTNNPQRFPHSEDESHIGEPEDQTLGSPSGDTRQKSSSDQGKVAFIAGKRQGGAVWRNSAKRRMRAICRELHGPWSGLSIIFLANKRILDASYSKVRQSCRETLATLGCKVS